LFTNKHSREKATEQKRPENFERLYNTHKSMVYGIALRYLRCKDDANDVVQETFISAYTNYDQYDENKPIGPWIKRIAINAALMYIRKNYRFKLIENERELDSSHVPIDDEKEEGAFTQEDLIAILHELPNGYRTVFNLYAIDGLTHQEIAEYMEITESTSRSQLLKARKMIKGILEQKMSVRYARA
jgi:RNA polymerase sigma-70 factor (ECF subfamily)